MAILNFQVGSIGESGVLPSLIYIQTNNTIGEVQQPGFLNGLLAEGIQISDTQMALIITKTSPNAKASSVGLFAIAISGGVITLTEATGGGSTGGWDIGGNPLVAPGAFGSTSAEDVSFIGSGTEYMRFEVASNQLFLHAALFTVHTSNQISLQSDTANITIDTPQTILIGANQSTDVEIGNNSVGTNSLNINMPIVFMNNLGTATAADILYFNPGTKAVTYGAAPAGAAAWDLVGNAGTNPASNFMGSIDAQDVVFKANSVEIMRMVETTSSLKMTNNVTIGSPAFQAAVIYGSLDAGAMVMSATFPGGMGPTGGTILLGGSTNSNLPASVGLIAPSSNVVIITDLSAGPSSGFSGAGLGLGQMAIGNFGNATTGVLVFQNQTLNPTTAGASSGMLYVGTDNELHFLNNSADYVLTPPSGISWNLTGTNSGASLKFGTNTTDGWIEQVNSVTFLTVATTGWTLSSPQVSITSSAANMTIQSSAGHQILIEADGELNLDSISGAVEITANGGALDAAGDGVIIDVIPSSSNLIQIGATNAQTILIGSTSVIGLDLFSTRVGVTSPAITLASVPGSITLDGTTVSVNDAGAARDLNLGNVFAGNNITLQAASVFAPNLPNTTQTNYVAFNSGTGALTYQSIASLSGSYWNTSGNNTGAGLKLGAGTGSGFQMTADNFAFLTVSTSINVDFGANEFSVSLVNDSESITLINPWSTGPEYILLSCGGPSNDSFVRVKPLDISVSSRATIQLLAATALTGSGTSASFSSTAGDVTLTSVGGDIDLIAGTNMSLSAAGQLGIETPLFNINTAGTANVLNIGNPFTGNTLNLNSDAIAGAPNTLNINTASTLHLGSGGAMTLGSGASVDMSAPTVTINPAATTNTTTIGNALAGNNITLNSVQIEAPNIPAAPGSGAVALMWDTTTGQIYHA